jgi:carbonic anhydrase/acetyltransferase-like protein (isoleucine patch superfamily)
MKTSAWRLVVLCFAMEAAFAASTLHIDPKADIHPTAVLMGTVTVGPYTRIGPKVVIQGDVTIGGHVTINGNAVINSAKLTIGDYVRIDYGARVVDGRPGDPLSVGDDVWIGGNATIRGARLEKGSAVGNGAVADFNTHLEPGAILAPGSIAQHDTTIEANALLEGNPAAITKTAATDDDRLRIFGVIPSSYLHEQGDRMAREIGAHPPRVRSSYPGLDGHQFWKGKVTVNPTAQVHPTAILIGPLTIGAHTRVGPYAIIQGATIGHHCDIRAGTNIRSSVRIGDYVYIGERVHIGASRDGGFDDPLWIKDYTYMSVGSVDHAARIDEGVYYGANTMTDYGVYVEANAVLRSGAVVWHDTRIRSEAVAEGNPELMETKPGISRERLIESTGFVPREWLAAVHAKELEQPQTYDEPLATWEHSNTGQVKGIVQPGAILAGNVSVGEGTKIYPGAYIEGNVSIGKEDAIVVDVMIVSKNLTIGDHTHVYDKAILVDGRDGRDQPRVGNFCWINHSAFLQGVDMSDFSLSNVGVSEGFGTKLEREALLLNGSSIYPDTRLPAKSISYGDPARVRVTDSTMRERMVFFYGRDFPTWDRQASPEELKEYTLPK